MIFDPNPLFYEMVGIYTNNYSQDNKITICNEGSSRSSKTWDFFHLLVMFCDHNRNEDLEIYILRNKLVDCRDFTYKEFKKCLKIIGIWDDDKKTESPKPYYNLFGNHIYFRGLDEDKEAPPSDIIFVNEALEIETRSKLKGWFMRCRMLQVLDWNPKFTQHWCFDMEGQPNVYFTHSTYKNNKHLEKSVIQEIESYEPTLNNIKNSTADKYQWEVYGLGKRSAPEGLIFQYVNYIDNWPIDVACVHGLDFGFTADPTSLVKVGENKTDIYLELLLYQPTETPQEIDMYCQQKGIDKKIICTADSSDKFVSEKKGTVEMVNGLRKLGWNISKVSKTKSVMYWLLSMKKKRINIVVNDLSHFAKKEQENYKLKLVNGIAINQPEDKFNHFWDASRYGHMSLNKKSFSVNKR